MSDIAYLVSAVLILGWAVLDFLGYAIIAMWRTEYEDQLETKTDEPRQDEQRRSGDGR